MGPLCSVCGEVATVVDYTTGENVYYCAEHADDRLICAGSHEHFAPGQPVPAGIS